MFKVHAIPLATEETPEDTDQDLAEGLEDEATTAAAQVIITKVKVTAPPQVETTTEDLASEESVEVEEQEKSTEESPSTDPTEKSSAHHYRCQHLMAFVPVLLIALSLKF